MLAESIYMKIKFLSLIFFLIIFIVVCFFNNFLNFSNSLLIKLKFNREKIDIKYVIDGDSLKLEDGRRLRLVGIDCYEISDYPRAFRQIDGSKTKDIQDVIKLGYEAKGYLKRIIDENNGNIYLKKSPNFDKFGRVLGTLYSKNGENINKMMLKNGLCMPYIYKENFKAKK